MSKSQCLKCNNNTKGNNFCDDKCRLEWVNNNFVTFSSQSTSDEDEKGTKCKKCEQKVSDAYKTIDSKQVEELINHLASCSGKTDNNKDKDDGERERENKIEWLRMFQQR